MAGLKLHNLIYVYRSLSFRLLLGDVSERVYSQKNEHESCWSRQLIEVVEAQPTSTMNIVGVLFLANLIKYNK